MPGFIQPPLIFQDGPTVEIHLHVGMPFFGAGAFLGCSERSTRDTMPPNAWTLLPISRSFSQASTPSGASGDAVKLGEISGDRQGIGKRD